METEKAILATKSIIRAEKKEQQITKNSLRNQYTEEGIIIYFSNQIFVETQEFCSKTPPSRLMEQEDSFSDAAKIAHNAIIYYELSNARKTNYKFSFEEMLSMRGNTAMYLLYAYARIK